MKEHISIIGGGIGGLCTAVALQQRGIKVRVFERNPETITAGAGIVISANALKSLEFLGLKESVQASGFAQDDCTVFSEAGKVLTSLNYQESQLPNYTFILRSQLSEILASALHPDTIIYSRKLVDFSHNSENAIMHFEDGTSEETDYMIGSDGIFSAVRRKLLPHKQLRYAGYTCWRGISDPCPYYKKSNSNEIAFMEYEKQRLHRTRKVVQESWALGKVAQIDIPLLCSLRNQVLKLTPNAIRQNHLKSLFELDAEF
ncbi:FAD-dependent oxidoreductase [Bacillus sp. M6-12]|uniref:FAD-dependent oxidoreductase n=1 Tax=Bacillus sp. M6-12 TaxID=2054166 RepID=UPI0015E07218|nr:FAD-dependent oxidoreductase [Bacillus sp. M6-12]